MASTSSAGGGVGAGGGAGAASTAPATAKSSATKADTAVATTTTTPKKSSDSSGSTTPKTTVVFSGTSSAATTAASSGGTIPVGASVSHELAVRILTTLAPLNLPTLFGTGAPAPAPAPASASAATASLGQDTAPWAGGGAVPMDTAAMLESAGMALPTAPPGSSAVAHDYELLESGNMEGVWSHGWMLASLKTHIAPDEVVETWSDELGFSMPEMIYHDNCLVIANPAAGFCLIFDAHDALANVRRLEVEEMVKVPFATEWTGQARRDVAKTFNTDRDWTFTTEYNGTAFRVQLDGSGDGAVQVDGDTEVGCTVLTGDDAASAIDYDMLKRRDPIAWFDEVLLFEDELHDCGHAAASVKVRVMPGCWFALARFWMRVDGSLMRVVDTRVFHRFDSGRVIRQTTVKEASFAVLGEAMSGGVEAAAKVMDPNPVVQFLATVSDKTEALAVNV